MKHVWKKITISLLCYGIAAITPTVLLSTIHPNNQGIYHQIAHRGWSAKYFQNSYAAFDAAVGGTNSKFYGAETDLQMDQDGTIWCSHYINPFENQSEKIDELTTAEINNRYLKIDGSIDNSTLPSKAFPSGKLNPYKVKVPHDAQNAQLCKFWNADNNDGYLNCFLNNHAHPVIELKVESTLKIKEAKECMKIDQGTINKLVTNVLVDIKAAEDYVTSGESLLSRCYFVSFFDDLLDAMIKEINSQNLPIFNTQFQKLLDEGTVGQYVVSSNQQFTNKDPGTKSGSNTNYKNYQNYLDGSWTTINNQKYPIGVDIYYGLITSKIIQATHSQNLKINSWTADYSRLEIAEPYALAILDKFGCDYFTVDNWLDF
ncbi:MAG: hypothetical protein LBP70_01310 [Mycoplasmataceae bacterium]|nr:hypothetical protein [Mycoplasmataceae bacterium]